MATLLVDRYASQCGDCLLNADPGEALHSTVWGVDGSRPGCGAVFTGIAAVYETGDGGEAREAAALRPDLPYAGVISPPSRRI
jgi:hypothetical protein